MNSEARTTTSPEQKRLQQARRERHGKWLLCLMCCLIVPPEMIYFVAALSGDMSFGKWLVAVSFPLLTLHACSGLWLGNLNARKWLAFFMFVRSLPWLGLIVAFSTLTIRNFQPGTASAAFLVAWVVLKFPLGVTTIYLGLTLLCLWSKSLIAFVQFRMRTAPHWTKLPSTFTEALGQPPIEDRIASIFMATSHTPQYTEFSDGLIEVLEELELEHAIVDYVNSQLEDAAEKQEPQEFDSISVLRSLPTGFRTVYTLWHLKADVDNGGFFQFFVNKGMDFSMLTLESCQQVHRDDVRMVLVQAIETYLPHEDVGVGAQKMLQDVRLLIENDFGERYVAAEEACSIDTVNRAYHALEGVDIDGFIRNNKSLFQAQHLHET